MRHDFAVVLTKEVTIDQVNALCDDLYTIGFRTDVESVKNDAGDVEEHVVLIALDSETKILEEAERQRISRSFTSLPSDQ